MKYFAEFWGFTKDQMTAERKLKEIRENTDYHYVLKFNGGWYSIERKGLKN